MITGLEKESEGILSFNPLPLEHKLLVPTNEVTGLYSHILHGHKTLDSFYNTTVFFSKVLLRGKINPTKEIPCTTYVQIDDIVWV